MKRGYFLLLTLCAGIAACSGCARKSQGTEKKEVRQEKGEEEQKKEKIDDQKEEDDGTVPRDEESKGDGKVVYVVESDGEEESLRIAKY